MFIKYIQVLIQLKLMLNENLKRLMKFNPLMIEFFLS